MAGTEGGADSAWSPDRKRLGLPSAARLHPRGGDDLHGSAEVLLGDVLRRNGEVAEAEPLLLAGHAALSGRRIPGFDFALRVAIESLVALYEDQRREEEAARYRALLALVHRE